MEKNNALLIIEESEDAKKEENSAAKLKVALANKKLKDDFFKENEINKTAEIFNDDYENEIDQSILEMEGAADLTYDSESDGEAAPSNGHFSKRRVHSSTSTSSSDADDDDGTISAKNSKLIESSVLQRMKLDDYQHSSSSMLPFYGRRRLSECIEESESEEEVEQPAELPIVVPSTNEAAPKKRFIVTRTKEEPVLETPVKQPVSILKKTPSPPSNQKLLLAHSPKKIRYEAEGLKDVSAQKNSQTIHFPCSSGAIERANVRTFFSPQGFLKPHLDRRYFDSSLVEVRASQTLNNSSKSLDDKGNRQLDDNVWIKRHGVKSVGDKTRVSSDSFDGSKNYVGESVSCGKKCEKVKNNNFLSDSNHQPTEYLQTNPLLFQLILN